MKDTPVGQKETTLAERPWPPQQGEWTYEDWLKLPDDGYRYKVIDAVLYMSPPPLIRQQRGLIRFVDLFLAFLKLHPVGEVLIAPVGVRFPTSPSPCNLTSSSSEQNVWASSVSITSRGLLTSS